MNTTSPNHLIFAVLRFWIPLVLVITILCGLVYLTVQQNYRQTANDPQIQMAEDAAMQLAAGKDPSQFIPIDKVDMANSLAPFIVIYDNTGAVMTGSGQLNGHTPVPPSGVFDYARQNTEDRFTWQPQTGVRSATVVVYYHGNSTGFVLASRSLREIENREQTLGLTVLGVWFVASLVTLVAIATLDTAKSYMMSKRG